MNSLNKANAHPNLSPHILLVDDNPANILVASTFLESFGYTFDVAINGLDAVKNMESNTLYAAVIMDIRMPIMDGLEATRIIRKFEKSENRVPVGIIAMTAEALTGSREKCLEAGMNDFISKPFSPFELQSKLMSVISK